MPECPNCRQSIVWDRKVFRSSGRMNVVNPAGFVNRRDKLNRSINRCGRKIRKGRWKRAIARGTINIRVVKQGYIEHCRIVFTWIYSNRKPGLDEEFV